MTLLLLGNVFSIVILIDTIETIIIIIKNILNYEH